MTDQPVYFSRSALCDVDRSQLIFNDTVINSSVLSRSSVLSCLADAGGDAKLPDSVTVSDFKQWLAAVADSSADFRSKPFFFMCKAIKVADAVADKHIDAWIAVAAKRIQENALSSSSEETKHAAYEGLALLPNNLQYRVLAAAVSDPQLLDSLLQFFPTRLHASVLAATVTPKKMLRMHLRITSVPALEALACLPASPPSVLSLHVDSDSYSAQPHPWPANGWPEMVPSLLQALHHHAGLTSLVLHSSPIIATSHELVLPAMAALTSIQSLDLEGVFPFSASTIPHVGQLLHAMPKLRHLKLSLSDEAANAGTKRQRGETDREAAVPSGRYQCCLAGMLSHVTSLTSLTLRISQAGHVVKQGRYFTVLEPLVLPHLVQATAVFDDNVRLAAAFRTNLIAPLTSLQLTKGLQVPPRMPHAACGLAVQQLLGSLTAFTRLRCFGAALPTDPSRVSSTLDALSTALPSLLTPFHHLESLTLSAEPAVVHRIMSQLPTAAPALTQLYVGFWGAPAPAWPGFFQTLGQFQLQHLELEGWSPEGYGLAALQAHTQLTALGVGDWECLGSPADREALAGMTRLQHLCLDDHNIVQLPHGYIASMQTLSSLTSLTLFTSEERGREAPVLVEHVPPQSLPALRELTVTLHDPDLNGANEFTLYIAVLPALKVLTVHIFPLGFVDVGESDEEGHAERVAEVMEGRQQVKACLSAAAAGAGVALTLVTDEYDHLW